MFDVAVLGTDPDQCRSASRHLGTIAGGVVGAEDGGRSRCRLAPVTRRGRPLWVATSGADPPSVTAGVALGGDGGHWGAFDDAPHLAAAGVGRVVERLGRADGPKRRWTALLPPRPVTKSRGEAAALGSRRKIWPQT